LVSADIIPCCRASCLDRNSQVAPNSLSGGAYREGFNSTIKNEGAATRSFRLVAVPCRWLPARRSRAAAGCRGKPRDSEFQAKPRVDERLGMG